MDRKLSFAQQENLIALLVHNDEQGKIASGLVDSDLFEGDYREIVTPALAFWQTYKHAPKQHMHDLLAYTLEDSRNPRKAEHFHRILVNIAEINTRGINTEYVLSELGKFVAKQKAKSAALRMVEELSRDNTDMEIVYEAADDIRKAQMLQFGRGMRLDDPLDAFLEWKDQQRNEFKTGIPPLDNARVVPARGELMLLIGGKGRGKSWFLIHLAKEALRAGKKVLHISLENSAMETRQRYYQALFGASKHAVERTNVLRMKFDEHSGLIGWEHDTIQPAFDMDDDNVRYDLETRIQKMGNRMHNIVIERFPNRQLTVDGLRSFMDHLQQVEQFVPDMLALDYAKLMKLKGNNADKRYLSLSENMEDLRALAIERNMAVVTVDQLNRSGYDKPTAHSTHVGGSWDEIATTDITITHSATEAETNLGLCRLYVDHARSEGDKFGLILTQHLTTGQFCIEATRIPRNYFDPNSRLMPQERPDPIVHRPEQQEPYEEDEED